MRLAVFVLALGILSSERSYAQRGDGVYGRFDSSGSLVLAAGAAIDPASGRVGVVVDARARILDAAGFAVALHSDAPGRARLFTGVELRPFFPAFFLQSWSTGRPYLDLFVQSLGVELGVDLALQSPVPIGFTWGLSLEVPLLTPERFAHGLGLRLGARHTAFRSDARPNPVGSDDSRWSVYAVLAIGLDLGNRVADWEPARHRAR